MTVWAKTGVFCFAKVYTIHNKFYNYINNNNLFTTYALKRNGYDHTVNISVIYGKYIFL